MKNKEFDDIMNEITKGLTGDIQTDFNYLQDQMERYKNHKYGQEVIRACGRLVYELIPEDKKKEFDDATKGDRNKFEESLKKVRFYQFEKNYDKALELIEKMVSEFEEAGFCKDDAVSEYHTFREPMEEIIYCELFDPQKEVRPGIINMSDMYLQYGSILIDVKRWEDAEKALKKAMKWNPTYAMLAFEHAECFKMRGMLEEYNKHTREIIKIIFRPNDLARYYRNLGYYYVEVKDYKTAVCCFLYSLIFEKSNMVQSELYYISQQTGELYNLSDEELSNCLEKHDIPLGPDVEILKIAYGYGMHYYEEKNMEAAEYFLGIFAGFIDDEEVNRILEEIQKN